MLRSTFIHLARMFPFLTEQQSGRFLISVHAKPGARASAFAGALTPQSGEVDLRIAAPPVEGQANAELIRFMDEVIEGGLHEMNKDPATFFDGTSYAQVVAADAAAADAAQGTVNGITANGATKAKKKGKAAEASLSVAARQGRKSDAGRANQGKRASATALPERVEVSLVRGGTSREKTVLALFPGTRAQLLAILEKASQV